MLSRYQVFCQVIELGSFTKAAAVLGYSQSAVSQIIKGLEQELGTVLIDRKKDGLTLTNDGRQYLPYLQAVEIAEKELQQKQQEIHGLTDSTIRIGTFTSVSRNLLPPLMRAFKEQYPDVKFILRQGEYTSIAEWIRQNHIDIGFVNHEAVSGLEVQTLYQDEMLAVLPPAHPLAAAEKVTLSQLTTEPFILLEEGAASVTLKAFHKHGLQPAIAYEVYDDYAIIEMIRQGLGISIMYRQVLTDFQEQLLLREIVEKPQRTVAIAWRNWETMSHAARLFAQFILERTLGS